ncbi:Ribosomal protein S12/S23 [Trinorchestia longiramus]|nr:Ribosomal protein S12/S23 [Trinorchestia longiramus]
MVKAVLNYKVRIERMENKRWVKRIFEWNLSESLWEKICWGHARKLKIQKTVCVRIGRTMDDWLLRGHGASTGFRHLCVKHASAATPFRGMKSVAISTPSLQACSSLQVLLGLLPALPAATPSLTTSLLKPKFLLPSPKLFNAISNSKALHTSSPCAVNSFLRIHILGPLIKPRRKKNPLGYDVPWRKGVVLKTVIKKPRKPNSANRKCVLLRLSNGKEMTAFVPGEGHTLQEHNVVLVKHKRLRDTPGVKITCIRGEFDLGEVVKKVM